MGKGRSSIHDFSVTLKCRVPFEMCAMLGPGKEVLIGSMEGRGFYGLDGDLMKTFSVLSKSYVLV